MPTLSSNNMTAVSWGAIIAGTVCATALSFILLMLGFGLGLTAISPWGGEGLSAEAIGFGTIIWLVIMQLAASGLGGYLTGRLRSKWPDIHNHEVYFRDTAHGLTTWSVSTLIVVTLMASSITNVLGAGARAGGEILEGAATVAEDAIDSPDYHIDAMLRGGEGEQRAGEDVRGEVLTIVVRSLREGELRDQDQQYLAELVARHTDLNQNQAQQRITDIFAEAQEQAETAMEAVDEARSTAAATALWMFVALLAGAFFAALMATFGGRQRDAVLQN